MHMIKMWDSSGDGGVLIYSLRPLSLRFPFRAGSPVELPCLFALILSFIPRYAVQSNNDSTNEHDNYIDRPFAPR